MCTLFSLLSNIMSQRSKDGHTRGCSGPVLAGLLLPATGLFPQWRHLPTPPRPERLSAAAVISYAAQHTVQTSVEAAYSGQLLLCRSDMFDMPLSTHYSTVLTSRPRASATESSSSLHTCALCASRLRAKIAASAARCVRLPSDGKGAALGEGRWARDPRVLLRRTDKCAWHWMIGGQQSLLKTLMLRSI